ncbi:ABC-2 type transport system ATP-binding protein [Crossiella equi]|uniref:ABC-2 type transport system ATP-binding protein n=1 Tax=Crossiella equi TaxID=130796 RepID=A0ABS5A6Y4_9PSEU|nr:ATP-binding cassette domain-containing protein [Crossiella equi]MBP2472354.1 ABC-2 type transport system ATP-binding protein [Crossiella equi]
MIVVEGLTRQFRGGGGVHDLSFTVRPGAVTGFLGPNGAGKSTAIKLMLGLLPGSGRATFGGVAYQELPDPLRTVGALVDPGAVHPARTARAHLRMVAAGGGLPATRVGEVLDLVGLGTVAGQRVGQFSLGMRQRLGLATALLGDPQYLILDEPANGLDPEGVRWFRHFAQRLAAEGRTVFASSHLLAEMALLAQDVIVIGGGRLLSAGSMAEFVAGHTSSTVVVRTPEAARLAQALAGTGLPVRQPSPAVLEINTDNTDQVGEVIAREGIPVLELFVRRSDLEEAFMAATAHTAQHRGAL